MNTYWQGEIPLAASGGMCALGASLPQDQATAAVVLAAILARNFAAGQWPGWYRAQVDEPGGAVAVVEDDARVRLARGLLERRAAAGFTVAVLAVVRGELLAQTSGGAGAAVRGGRPGSVTGSQGGCGR